MTYRIAALVLVVALAACSSGATPSQQNLLLAATNGYAAAQTVAIQYTSLPRCGQPKSPALCSDPGAVATIRSANSKGVIALNAAQSVVRDPSATSSAINEAIASANAAVSALNQAIPTKGQ
jgi:hypothetical protein